MNISLHFLEKTNLSKRTELKSFLHTISKKEKTKIAALSIVFCSDNYLLEINKDFLNHNYFTDIITFDLSNDKTGKTAEIYISIDRIKSNSTDYQCSIKHELHRVIFHGVLHLCGYKDKTTADSKLMKQMEDYYLDLYFNNNVPRGTS